MEVKSFIAFLLLMLAMCILYCQSSHARTFTVDFAVIVPVPTEPQEQEGVYVAIGQSEECELGGLVREVISSLKQRVALLLAALKQQFGDDFQLSAPTYVTPTESPPAMQPADPEASNDSLPCSFQGHVLLHGETIILNPCTECRCKNGTPTCEIESCAVDPECRYYELSNIHWPGECCPRCVEATIGKSPCSFRGLRLVHEQTIIVDPCMECWCENGTVSCSRESCPSKQECPPEEAVYPFEVQCCPRCVDKGRLTAPQDCNDIRALESGIYTVIPFEGGEAVTVFCDFDTLHGPWTVIQRRQNGSVNFYRDMVDYKAGFGKLEEEFWLGLDKIYSFVSQSSYQLRIDLHYFGYSKYAIYDDFSISDESDGYRLSIGRFSAGNTRDSLSYHNGMQFSTRDVDNDFSKKNCAMLQEGAWWYKNCLRSNLNGRYRDPTRKHPNGLTWADWRGYTASMSFVEMKIRRFW